MEYGEKLRYVREEAQNSILRDKHDGPMNFLSRISNWFKN